MQYRGSAKYFRARPTWICMTIKIQLDYPNFLFLLGRLFRVSVVIISYYFSNLRSPTYKWKLTTVPLHHIQNPLCLSQDYSLMMKRTFSYFPLPQETRRRCSWRHQTKQRCNFILDPFNQRLCYSSIDFLKLNAILDIGKNKASQRYLINNSKETAEWQTDLEARDMSYFPMTSSKYPKGGTQSLWISKANEFYLYIYASCSLPGLPTTTAWNGDRVFEWLRSNMFITSQTLSVFLTGTTYVAQHE